MSRNDLGKLAIAALLIAGFVAGCDPGGPVLALTVTPSDAQVSIDGYVHPGGSPHIIEFKSAGKYELTAGRPGYKPVTIIMTMGPTDRVEQSLELAPDSGGVIPNHITITPPPPLTPPIPIPYPEDGFELYVTSSPAGALVTLKDPGVMDRRDGGLTPMSVTLRRTAATEVTITMAGYKPHRRLVVAPSDGGNVNLHVTLERNRTGGAIDPPDPLDPPIQIIDPPYPPVDQGSYGYLSITSVPWSAVLVDGKSVGNTPIVNLKVRTGTHRILMENRDSGLRRTKIVDVRPGERVSITEHL